MQSPLFKLVALTGVIGAGAMLVFHAQKSILEQQQQSKAQEFTDVEGTKPSGMAKSNTQAPEKDSKAPEQSEPTPAASFLAFQPQTSEPPELSSEPFPDVFPESSRPAPTPRSNQNSIPFAQSEPEMDKLEPVSQTSKPSQPKDNLLGNMEPIPLPPIESAAGTSDRPNNPTGENRSQVAKEMQLLAEQKNHADDSSPSEPTLAQSAEDSASDSTQPLFLADPRPTPAENSSPTPAKNQDSEALQAGSLTPFPSELKAPVLMTPPDGSATPDRSLKDFPATADDPVQSFVENRSTTPDSHEHAIQPASGNKTRNGVTTIPTEIDPQPRFSVENPFPDDPQPLEKVEASSNDLFAPFPTPDNKQPAAAMPREEAAGSSDAPDPAGAFFPEPKSSPADVPKFPDANELPAFPAIPDKTAPSDSSSSEPPPFNFSPPPGPPQKESLPVRPAQNLDSLNNTDSKATSKDSPKAEPVPDFGTEPEDMPVRPRNKAPETPENSQENASNPDPFPSEPTDPFKASPLFPPVQEREPAPTTRPTEPQPGARNMPNAEETKPTDPERGGLPNLSGTGTLDGSAPTGPQRPELQIVKDAPPNAVLNQPLVYKIRIKNIGQSPAHQVIVEDSIPRGSELKGTIPEAELDVRTNHLIWKLGTIKPGDESLIKVQIVPTQPGEIGSVATVRFVGRVAAKTVITSPKLSLEMSGSAEAVVGEKVTFRYTLSNTGDGPAEKVYLRNILPAGLHHPSGDDLEYQVGTLAPGQTKTVELQLAAQKAGQFVNTAVLTIDGQEQDRAAADIVVLDSRLAIQRTGPAQRFVNRAAKFTSQVTNQSSQTLQNIIVLETLPEGVELAAIPEHGRFDPTRRTITWTIAQLKPQETVKLQSSLVAAKPGRYACAIRAADRSGNQAEATSQLQVAGFSSLKVNVAQTTNNGGEVPVGEQVALKMTIQNRGSAPANNVVTEFEIPREMEFVAAQGPVKYQMLGNKIRFDAIKQLSVGESQAFNIVLVARKAGTPRVSASIWSNEQQPVREEEAVVVFREDP